MPVNRTVTREFFEWWVEHKLCPVLGDYTKGENRSVVMLDNASTHMSQKVIELITAKKTRIIFSAPFSPDLNPIENYFSVYKKYLKENSMAMTKNWQKVHWEALATVRVRVDSISALSLYIESLRTLSLYSNGANVDSTS